MILVLLLPAISFAQATATIAGRVLDMANGSPMGFASVVVEDAASARQLSGTLTGENGRFLIQGLAPGSYRIRVTVAGFYPADAEVLVSPLNQTYDLGDIRLPRLEGFEEKVTVTAEGARAAGIGTEVFRLEDGPTQSTGTLLDALKNLPGVTVDQEGKVSLRGSDRVAILIDGQQSSLTGFGSQRGLDSVSAANVEAIEIINNPSARFDAAGMAGIINIIYKQEQQLGLSGDFGLSLGVGQFSKQRSDLPTEIGSFSNNEKIIPSLNVNYRTEKLRTFVQSELLLQDDLPNNIRVLAEPEKEVSRSRRTSERSKRQIQLPAKYSKDYPVKVVHDMRPDKCCRRNGRGLDHRLGDLSLRSLPLKRRTRSRPPHVRCKTVCRIDLILPRRRNPHRRNAGALDTLAVAPPQNLARGCRPRVYDGANAGITTPSRIQKIFTTSQPGREEAGV